PVEPTVPGSAGFAPAPVDVASWSVPEQAAARHAGLPSGAGLADSPLVAEGDRIEPPVATPAVPARSQCPRTETRGQSGAVLRPTAGFCGQVPTVRERCRASPLQSASGALPSGAGVRPACVAAVARWPPGFQTELPGPREPRSKGMPACSRVEQSSEC